MQIDESSHATMLNEREAADILTMKVATLRKWRNVGCGPKFIKIGASVRYRHSDVMAWINANTFTSTREAKGA